MLVCALACTLQTQTDLLITGDLAGTFNHLAGHSAGAAPNTPTDVDRGGFRKDCHPTNLCELVSQFILNPCVQKVPMMICEACFLVQLCNGEQNVTTWSSAVAQQWFPKIAVDQGLSRINDTFRQNVGAPHSLQLWACTWERVHQLCPSTMVSIRACYHKALL